MLNVIKSITHRGGKVYEVGGCVRDSFLNRPSKDIDYLVTGVPLDNLIQVLSIYGRVDLVGQSFGVIKFTYQGETYDVALPRTEKSTGDGHKDFEVIADHSLSVEDDLLRRDFCFNAIARECLPVRQDDKHEAVAGDIIDPFGGVQDIADKVLRVVRPEAFVEDPLRILRGIQFMARFGFSVEAGTLQAMKDHAHLVGTISPERISIEMAKLLAADKPSDGFRLMDSLGILDSVFPEIAALKGLPQPAKFHAYDAFEHSLHAMDAAVFRNDNEKVYMRFSALVHDLGKAVTLTFKEDGTPTYRDHAEKGVPIVQGLIERLRFTSVPGLYFPVDRVLRLVEHHMFDCGDCADKTVRKFVARVGKDLVMDLLRLRVADRLGKGMDVDLSEWVVLAKQVRGLVSKKAAFSVKDLAINGRDLISAGMKPGKEMGATLNRLLGLVLDDPSLNTKDSLLKLAFS